MSGSVIIAVLLAVGAAAPAADPKIETIDELWAGFDPRALPLDVEVVKSWDEGDIHLEMLYFTGEEFAGEKTRIFGYFGRPNKVEGKIPGVLHVHGGGQTAILDWPRFWAKRGFACLSFDFCGNTNLPELGPGYKREHYTRWGKVPADMMKIGAGTQMTPTPRYNPWYHWTLAARRGLTFLETRPEVDKDKIGVFGISVGGTLTWSIAGVDSRVKAAAPIYGCGWEFYQYPPDVKAAVDDNLKLWRKLIAPEAHAPQVKCPLLYLSATNDGHGRMDLAFRTLDSLGSTARSQVFTPNYDHHVEPAEAKSLHLFMECHLKGKPEKWPTSPKVELAAGAGGVPEIRMKPDDEDRVSSVDVFYCLNNDWPTTRFWRRTAEAKRDKGTFTVAAPFLDKNDTIFTFANVTYDSGIRISSRLETQAVAEMPGAKPTLKRQTLIDVMDAPGDWNWVPAYTDPCREDRFFAQWKGPDGERGFTLDPKTFGYGGAMSYYFGTRKIGDPQFRGMGRKTLLLDYPAANAPEKLTVRLTNRIPPQNQVEFTAVVALPEKGDGAWRTIRMEASQFKDASGKTLPDWDHVEFFVLNGTNPANKPPVFKRLRWAE
jgi:dienelactone hydrolase